MTCGEPVPFRDPTGQYECTLEDDGHDSHLTTLYNENREIWVKYRWKSTE